MLFCGWVHAAASCLLPKGASPAHVSGPPHPMEDVNVPFVTSLFQKRSYGDEAANFGTIHYRLGNCRRLTPSPLVSILPWGGALAWVGAPAPPLRVSRRGKTEAQQD